jgi:uncharacterized cupredoxin-like copper-binding protein
MATKPTETAEQRRTREALATAVLVAVVAVAAIVLISIFVGGGRNSSNPVPSGGAAPATGPTPVYAQLGEMYIKPDVRSVPAGRTKFTVANIGTVMHEMVVVKTPTPAGQLPTNAAGEASEKGAVGEVSDLGPGRVDTLTLNLKPGHYALICNLPGHYKAGMYTNFHVQ